MKTAQLDKAIWAVCPIHGISIGRKDDKSTWRIYFKDEATEEQRAAAQRVIDAFDVAASEAEDAALKARKVLDEEEARKTLADTQIAALLDMTPTQVGAAIDAAFSDPAQRAILKRMARLILFAARKYAR